MQPRRFNLLLILLVITPLALRTWLGTYLIRDAARSTDGAQQAVLEESLLVADNQLLHDLRQFTDYLDSMAITPGTTALITAEQLAQHPWVGETWTADAQGQVVIAADKKRSRHSPMHSPAHARQHCASACNSAASCARTFPSKASPLRSWATRQRPLSSVGKMPSGRLR